MNTLLRMTPPAVTGIQRFRQLADQETKRSIAAYEEDGGRDVLLTALRIRAVENALLDLFGKGKLHGTIHTCVGQELTGAVLARRLLKADFITSNHRCHGHFIAATGNWKGLIDEIIGNRRGVSAGIGSSQHLYAENFISNGPQGALLPVAAGVALDRKHTGDGNIAISFIGEGTLGEGVLYETLNIDSLWGLPHLIVLENNLYSQTTEQKTGVAGDIAARAAAFGVDVVVASTWDVADLDAQMGRTIDKIRETNRPAFMVIQTYRLNAHSKGDDPRDPEEVRYFSQRDPLNVALDLYPELQDAYDGFYQEANMYIESGALSEPKLDYRSYLTDQLPRAQETTFQRYESNDTRRMHEQLNRFYYDMLRDPSVYYIGEDIADPYGGAFKISKGYTTSYPDRALTTPISEAAITGIGIGLAISGNRPLVEIMFGDFITYAFSQIVDNASKIHHMYNRGLSCPVIVRTPMGGRRGYGPTHSQSLERFFLGIDNTVTAALCSIVSVDAQLGKLDRIEAPMVLFENKVDYTMRPYVPPAGYVVEIDDAILPTIRVVPIDSRANITLVAYGGMARIVADGLLPLFEAADAIVDLIVPTSLHPLNMDPIVASVQQTGRLLVVEEGNSVAGVGAEIVARVTETLGTVQANRIGAPGVPIPSVPELENQALPGLDHVRDAILAMGDL